jgi:hypothetical protein
VLQLPEERKAAAFFKALNTLINAQYAARNSAKRK